MSTRILIAIVAVPAIGALAVSYLVGVALKPSCTLVQILAVGGCDGDGMCGSVILTQEGEVKKINISHPVTGFPECVSE